MKPTPNSSFLSVFLSPLERLESAKVIAVIAACFQYLVSDAFAGAFVLVFIAGVADYLIGVRAARLLDQYNSLIAHRGWLGKMSGFCLLLMIRALEYYLRGQGLDWHGAIATGIALSLFVVDLQSIAHHREELGAKPIPVLSSLLSWFQTWIQRMTEAKLPAAPADTPARRVEDVKP
jgi:hypothetical protein